MRVGNRGRDKTPAKVYIKNVFQRLMERKKIRKSGCWIPHIKPAPNGYVMLIVRFKNGEKTRNVCCHRFVYEQMRGKISRNLDIDHLCRNRACCNPDHLEPVTRATNLARGNGAAVTRARFESMTHCRKGHIRSKKNTKISESDGRISRICRICERSAKRLKYPSIREQQRARCREYYWRKKLERMRAEA